jgi:dihydrolipoamide dehydrogenase
MPTKSKTCDAVVIGAGPGGYGCAIRLGQLKQKVICVEKDEVGGVCLNWGCVPSKALISASHTYEKTKNGASMGILSDGIRVDANRMQDWKDGIVKKLTGGVKMLLRGNGAELLVGTARVTSPTTVEVKTKEGATETIEAKAIVPAERRLRTVGSSHPRFLPACARAPDSSRTRSSARCSA